MMNVEKAIKKAKQKAIKTVDLRCNDFEPKIVNVVKDVVNELTLQETLCMLSFMDDNCFEYEFEKQKEKKIFISVKVFFAEILFILLKQHIWKTVMEKGDKINEKSKKK